MPAPKLYRLCEQPECNKPHFARGMCTAHYALWRKHGDPQHKDRPTFGMTRDQAFDHYLPEIPSTDQCVEWTGPRETQGYGTFRSSGVHKAHRVSYERNIGPIPPGQLVRHTCDNPPCVNPRHLLLGTDADNNRDMMQRGRNRQPQGERNGGGGKLTADDVREIRRRYAAGGQTQSELGSRFGVSQHMVSLIVRGEKWTHVS